MAQKQMVIELLELPEDKREAFIVETESLIAQLIEDANYLQSVIAEVQQ